MKKNIFIGIGFLVCLFIFIPTVHADSGQLYKVNSEILKLRNAPDQNGTVLAELKNGTEVTIFQKSYGWGSTFYNGEEAWAALHQLKAVNETQVEEKDVEQPEAKEPQNQTAASLEMDTASGEAVESGKLYEVNASALRLRASPDKNSTIITALNMGTEVTIFQESYGWGRTFYNGKEAWIALEFLDEKDKSTATMSEVSEEADQQQQSIIEDTEKEKSEGEHVQKNEDEELEEARDEKDELEEELVQKSEDEELEEARDEKEESEVEHVQKSEDEELAEARDEKEELEEELVQKSEDEELEEARDEKEESEGELVQKNEDEELEEVHDEKEESVVETNDREENRDTQRKRRGGKTLSGYHFVIDPGHGGKDPGAVRSGVYEKTLTLDTAKKVAEQLHNKGASVTLTRMDDTFIPLEERVQISNSTNTDAFVSLHYNAFEDQSVRGIHTFYYDGDENRKFADTIHKSLINHVKLNDRGMKHTDFKVLKDNDQLAILLELGFMSNQEERKLVQTGKYQEKAAKGIVAGLEDYFN
jgi:N-acetylmuramoyl-L-alanine amidase